jgi:hypothetical protein
VGTGAPPISRQRLNCPSGRLPGRRCCFQKTGVRSRISRVLASQRIVRKDFVLALTKLPRTQQTRN